MPQTPTFRQLQKLVAALALALTIAAGCSYDRAAPAPAVPVPCENATAALAKYQTVISPIFDRNCRSCHGMAGTLGGGIVFATYQNINAYDTDVLLGCIRHTPNYDPMPKAGARIPDCDIARIEAWIAAGKPNN